ncbi:hypothetical protein SPFL3102_03484 [Sporomusaceae bacterium FL31]|nr:hypothetical protein SPFL3101_02356 [Sporomusaceae bacterium FL31]GCE35633.1 hypothetical protein SPFL3102_03484 [Sporomusaceae bacterium]
MTAGLRLLLLENSLPDISPHFPESKQNTLDESAGYAIVSPELTDKLQESVRAVCLHNPFWNDFRLLNFFRRYGLELTLAELTLLKDQSGVGSRTAVYRELLNLHTSTESVLSEQQIRFIERLNPAFRDRNLESDSPGQLLIYECLTSRRLQHKFHGPMYLHLFIDRFNGHTFAAFQQERSSQIGFNILTKAILPFYQQRQAIISTVICSQKNRGHSHDGSCLNIAKAAKQLDLTWQSTDQSFGTIESFHKFTLSRFFEGMRLYDTASNHFEVSFNRWLAQYNATQTFYKRRDFLSYVELGQCLRLSLD